MDLSADLVLRRRLYLDLVIEIAYLAKQDEKLKKKFTIVPKIAIGILVGLKKSQM